MVERRLIFRQCSSKRPMSNAARSCLSRGPRATLQSSSVHPFVRDILPKQLEETRGKARRRDMMAACQQGTTNCACSLLGYQWLPIAANLVGLICKETHAETKRERLGDGYSTCARPCS